ncbi:MAG: restriction endonuclease [Anaerolineae bacterium]|jgi:restriction endonuclease Mrr|nr:restriction endonuclease [Anaerolineae bacterium]
MDDGFIWILIIAFVVIVIKNRMPKQGMTKRSRGKRRYRRSPTALEQIANRTNRAQKLALNRLIEGRSDAIETLSPSDLEKLAAKTYSLLGYKNVKHTGGSNDGGVDVWMLNKKGFVEIVQCKQKVNRISKTELITFSKTMKQQHAEHGHYWAPGGFTQPAIDYAEEKNMRLYESVHIRRLIVKIAHKD